jgi:hypothetical protein
MFEYALRSLGPRDRAAPESRTISRPTSRGRPRISTGETRTEDRESEGTMLPGTTDEILGDQLLRIARDPDLRLKVYDQLREYCHQCRNRLNSLKLSIYLAMRQSPSPTADPWMEIERHYRELETRVEQIQLLCRPMALSRVTLGLDLLIEDRRAPWSGLMAEEDKALELIPPVARAVASFDVDRLGRVLDSVVAWRASDRSAARSARVRWWVEGGVAHIAWEEATPARGEPPSWTLPLLARVALAHGGDYRIETDRGWRLEVAWPSQPNTP